MEYLGLESTDFPTDIPIPEKPFLNPKQNEEIKEWVLTVSMNRNLDQVNTKEIYFSTLRFKKTKTVFICLVILLTLGRFFQSLPTDERGLYGASLHCPQKNTNYPTCILTGWPVFTFGAVNKGGVIEFKKGKHFAIKDEWMKIMIAVKSLSVSAPLADVVNFLNEWCGAPPTFSFQ